MGEGFNELLGRAEELLTASLNENIELKDEIEGLREALRGITDICIKLRFGPPPTIKIGRNND